jgi:phosphatidylserine/phosphatidylglycerophosphate/cardiolipin synthase-like enzyme
MTDTLVDDIQHFIEMVPLELSKKICTIFETGMNWNQVRLEILPLIHSPFLTDLISRIIHTSQLQKRLPGELAFAFRTALAVEARYREAPKLELIWSGPVFPPFSLRRTDETILQLIQQTNQRLTLVSFALYRVERLSQALNAAIERGVTVRMFMETENTKALSLKKLYGDVLTTAMHFYTWSTQQRLQSSQGKAGVLHAKAVIADSQQLFVSSANLTEYAMSLNIELGLLIQGGELPGRTDKIFDDYVERGVFVRYPVHEQL